MSKEEIKEVREKYNAYKKRGLIPYSFLCKKNLHPVEMKIAIKEADKWREITSKKIAGGGTIEWN